MKLTNTLIYQLLGIEFEPNQPKNIFGRLNDSVFAPLQVGRNITIEILPSDDVHRGLRG